MSVTVPLREVLRVEKSDIMPDAFSGERGHQIESAIVLHMKKMKKPIVFVQVPDRDFVHEKFLELLQRSEELLIEEMEKMEMPSASLPSSKDISSKNDETDSTSSLSPSRSCELTEPLMCAQIYCTFIYVKLFCDHAVLCFQGFFS